MADKNSLALIKEETLSKVEAMIKEYQGDGSLHFPENYSPQNAMKAAWLVLQETKDKDGKVALEVCTRNSVVYSLFDMVCQGLSVAKKQGYFIVRGNKLTFMRSYFGTMHATKRLKEVKDVVAQVIYEGDIFEYTIENGIKKILKHEQALENIDPEKIKGAYCTIIKEDGTVFTDIMNKSQIMNSWSKTSMKNNTVQKEFPDQMALRTVINRACKYYVNTSDDSDLIINAFNNSERAERESPEDAVEQEIKQNANNEMIDVEYEVVEDHKENQAKVENSEQMSFSGGPGF
ncbi:recombination protein RecT [Geosporobacter subterraneus DSM 17957]|uniref:Recombination protein RecT n=1 Tax=Geosporobacter subterraneus DSM 17957 TaxID=1121919 RepID=A0A1M6DSI8_9FIRM|nr:recombinase RecT [Geosporobacter subterraneus]SHI76171.1 recombination protein RecT [Geosporobacter subterraneus DSM 17957]